MRLRWLRRSLSHKSGTQEAVGPGYVRDRVRTRMNAQGWLGRMLASVQHIVVCALSTLLLLPLLVVALLPAVMLLAIIRLSRHPEASGRRGAIPAASCLGEFGSDLAVAIRPTADHACAPLSSWLASLS